MSWSVSAHGHAGLQLNADLLYKSCTPRKRTQILAAAPHHISLKLAELALNYYLCVSTRCIVIWVQTHLSTQRLIQYLGTSFLHIWAMRDAEVEIKERNRAYFLLKMTFERSMDSKRAISFILNTPMERPIFSLAYSYYCFRRQICTPSYAWNIEFMKERMCITAQ